MNRPPRRCASPSRRGRQDRDNHPHADEQPGAQSSRQQSSSQDSGWVNSGMSLRWKTSVTTLDDRPHAPFSPWSRSAPWACASSCCSSAITKTSRSCIPLALGGVGLGCAGVDLAITAGNRGAAPLPVRDAALHRRRRDRHRRSTSRPTPSSSARSIRPSRGRRSSGKCSRRRLRRRWRPGLMVQLGLLGLVYTYRHPAFGDEPFEAVNSGGFMMRTLRSSG